MPLHTCFTPQVSHLNHDTLLWFLKIVWLSKKSKHVFGIWCIFSIKWFPANIINWHINNNHLKVENGIIHIHNNAFRNFHTWFVIWEMSYLYFNLFINKINSTKNIFFLFMRKFRIGFDGTFNLFILFSGNFGTEHCFNGVWSNQMKVWTWSDMSNEVERKINCGVWTALELLISRGSSTNVWEKNDFQPTPAMVRRREKVRIRYVVDFDSILKYWIYLLFIRIENIWLQFWITFKYNREMKRRLDCQHTQSAHKIAAHHQITTLK